MCFLDLTPSYSSSLNTIANLFGTTAGIAAPLVVSAFTEEYSGIGGWRIVFYFTAGLCNFGFLLWHLFQTSDPVAQLNQPRPKKSVRYKEWFPWFRY
jgi:MFS family permease